METIIGVSPRCRVVSIGIPSVIEERKPDPLGLEFRKRINTDCGIVATDLDEDTGWANAD